jgi:hypothetical protein
MNETQPKKQRASGRLGQLNKRAKAVRKYYGQLTSTERARMRHGAE